MRIAHITPYDLAAPGGVNATVVQLVARQRAFGHEVDLIGGASAVVPLERWRRLRSWIARVPVNGSVASLAIATSPDTELVEIMASGRYDVVVAHEPALPLSAMALALSTGARVAVLHAFSETAPAAPPFVQRIAPALLQLDRAIAVSTAARDFASRYLDMPCTIIPNGVDVPERVSFDRSGATLLFLGRPEPRKGLATLLAAVAILRRTVPDLTLVVAGAGSDDQWAEYRARADALGVADATRFVGRVDEAAKARLFREAAAFCSPATGGESQGVVLLEAMAHGTPVVASDIAGYRTVISNEHDGLLVPAGDAGALADALARVLGNRILSRRIAARARDTVAREYDWRVVVPRHLDVYREAVAQHRPAALTRRRMSSFAHERDPQDAARPGAAARSASQQIDRVQ
ncbi:MAG TPA: glycosyltransferase family 4 protein [Candidatus Dormibacteraeota bacterium]|nr:glycosyltransferase family 4 protein [Candidatus Dormibacteraeota bacterium]